MRTYIKKVSKTLLFGLVILLIFTVIYLIYPKYQIHSVRVDDDTVVVTRINTITGEISTKYEGLLKFPRTESGKLKFIND